MRGEQALQHVVLRRLHLPLHRPLRSAHGEERVRDLVVVEAVDGAGRSGWGECSALARPTYTSEYTGGAWAVLRDELAPALVAGRELEVVGHPMASAGAIGALRDLGLRRRGRSLVDQVAVSLGRPRPAVPRTAVVGRGPVADVVAAVAAEIERGVALVKLKVTPGSDDLEGVDAVRRNWPDLDLAVDGNGTLDARTLSVLDAHRLAYVEQPAPVDDLVGSAELARRCDTPIALDESISSVDALRTAAALGAGHLVNVKPARLGGTEAAVEVVLAARDVGWGAFVGGMLESGIGRAAALAVAASELLVVPTDLGPSDRYVERDVTTPIVVDDRGRVVVPGGPGIGVEVDRVALDAATVDRVVVEAA
ncbi:MAG: o-succinylbenzoate synthase [Actinobacteria bacterium]|nr:o-succinylbenzoate synthase [Actinomycetota bacterium]